MPEKLRALHSSPRSAPGSIWNRARPATVDRARAVHVESLAERLVDVNTAVRRGAAEALGRAGTLSLPHRSALTRCLEDSDSGVRRSAKYALEELGIEPPISPRHKASCLPEAQDRERMELVQALIRLGDAGAAALADYLEHPDPRLRGLVAEAIDNMAAELGSSSLAGRIRERDAWTRAGISESFIRLNAPCPPSIDDIMSRLITGSVSQKRRAMALLGQRSAEGVPHAAALAKHLLDPDRGISSSATEALGRISSTEPEAAAKYGAEMQRQLCDPNAYTRRAAVEAFLQMDTLATPHAHMLASCLRDDDSIVRRKAADALARLGIPAAAPYLSSIANLLNDREPLVRQAAAKSLLQMGSAAAAFLNLVANLLHDSAAGIRWTVLEGLEGLGDAGADALAGHIFDDKDVGSAAAKQTLLRMAAAGNVRAQKLLHEAASCGTASPMAAPHSRAIGQSDTSYNQPPAHIRMRGHCGPQPGVVSPGRGRSRHTASIPSKYEEMLYGISTGHIR